MRSSFSHLDPVQLQGMKDKVLIQLKIPAAVVSHFQLQISHNHLDPINL